MSSCSRSGTAYPVVEPAARVLAFFDPGEVATPAETGHAEAADGPDSVGWDIDVEEDEWNCSGRLELLGAAPVRRPPPTRRQLAVSPAPPRSRHRSESPGSCPPSLAPAARSRVEHVFGFEFVRPVVDAREDRVGRLLLHQVIEGQIDAIGWRSIHGEAPLAGRVNAQRTRKRGWRMAGRRLLAIRVPPPRASPRPGAALASRA